MSWRTATLKVPTGSNPVPATSDIVPLAMTNDMDAAEAHALRFLEHLGIGPVRYEPDGNQPPDFVTANGIAVEVRRLNQHRVTADGHTALEHDAFPITASSVF